MHISRRFGISGLSGWLDYRYSLPDCTSPSAPQNCMDIYLAVAKANSVLSQNAATEEQRKQCLSYGVYPDWHCKQNYAFMPVPLVPGYPPVPDYLYEGEYYVPDTRQFVPVEYASAPQSIPAQDPVYPSGGPYPPQVTPPPSVSHSPVSATTYETGTITAETVVSPAPAPTTDPPSTASVLTANAIGVPAPKTVSAVEAAKTDSGLSFLTNNKVLLLAGAGVVALLLLKK